MILKARSGPRAGTALAVATGLLFGLVALAMVLIVNGAMREQALTEAETKAQIILDQNLAIHAYFTQQLKPSVFELSAAGLSSDYFDPRWMSSSHAVREIGALVDGLNSEAYQYRDGAVNARNPLNEADSAERDYLASLATVVIGASTIEGAPVSPAPAGAARRLGVVTINGAPYLEIVKAGEVLEQSCLRCHGDPAAAPAGLVRQYGAERGFHREAEVGRVISVVSVRVPLLAAYAAADRLSLTLSGLLLAVLAALFVSQQFLGRRLILAPLDLLRDKALQIASNKEHLGETIPVPDWQELGELTAAFNVMSERLRASADETEQRVQDRTAELVLANGQMEEMIERQKVTEKALRASEGRFRGLVANSPDGIALTDELGRVAEWNDSVAAITGLSRESVLGRPLAEVHLQMVADRSLLPRIAERQEAAFREMAASGQSPLLGRLMETEFARPDGSLGVIQMAMFLVDTEGGRTVGVICRDVTQVRRTEQALRESEQQYRLLFDQMSTGFALHDIICDDQGRPCDYRFVEVNPAFERLTGLRRADAIGRTVRDLMPDTEPEWIADYGRVALTGEAISFERESAALGRGYQVTAFCPKPGQFAVTFTDVTARRRAEAALLASERQISLITDSLPVLVGQVDAQERYRYVNQAYLDWFGVGREQIIGRTIQEVVGDTVYARTLPFICRVLQGERVSYEATAMDGSGKARQIAAVLLPEVAAGGQVMGYVALIQDITEKKLAEDRLRASLREKEVLLREVHHRVKNNLQVVSSLLKLQSRFTKDPVALQAFRESQHRISAMSLLHTKLCQSKDLSNIPFGDYVTGLCSSLLRSFGAGDAVDLKVSAEGVSLGMDTAVSCGLIVNELVSNALKYGLRTPDGGLGSPHGRPLVSVSVKEAQGQIRMEIADNGVGLPEDLEFRQTQSLGLQLVATLVEQLDGTLEISGMGGIGGMSGMSGMGGARFVIVFPGQRTAGE